MTADTTVENKQSVSTTQPLPAGGRTSIEQFDGCPAIHAWSSGAQRWACVAYDHGPMCRLCQPVEETLGNQWFFDCLKACGDGELVARADTDGKFIFTVRAEPLRTTPLPKQLSRLGFHLTGMELDAGRVGLPEVVSRLRRDAVKHSEPAQMIALALADQLDGNDGR